MAILLVLLAHAQVPHLSGGLVGVDVFFVISGFLITGQLTASLRERGRIDFAGFYARRARRILPASLVVVVLTAVAAAVWVTPVRLAEVLRHACAAALSVPNVVFALEGTDYLAETVPSPFRQYWSLGVEEQYYLLGPLVMLALFVVGRRRTAVVAIGLVALVSLSFAACVAETAAASSFAFFLLPFRAWELGVGGLLALAPLHRIPSAARTVLSLLGLAGIGFAAIWITDQTAYPGAAAALPVLAAAAVVAGVDAPWGAVILLGRRPLQFVGRISYSLYLVHWPLLVLPNEAVQWQEPLRLRVHLLLAALAIPVAWAMYRLVEEPARRIRWPARITLVRAAVATTTVAVALTGASGLAASPALATTRTTPRLSTLVVDPPGTAFVPRNLSPSLAVGFGQSGELNDLRCQQGLDGSAVIRCDFGDLHAPVTVALFGDSHAAKLFEAFRGAARIDRFHLETYVRSRCRTLEEDGAWARPTTASCGEWRVAAQHRIAADPPDVIVLANHTSADRGTRRTEADWMRVVSDSVRRLPTTSRVLIMNDTPQLPASPLYCLAAHLDSANRCGVAAGSAFDPVSVSAFRASAAQGTVGLLDLDPYLCNRTWCPAIIGRNLVYTDDHHLTDTFSAALSEPLAMRLRTLVAHPRPS